MKPRGINYLFDFKKPKAIQQFHNFVDESVSSRRLLEENQQKYDAEDKDIRKDIFHYLFHADDQETGMPAYTENELNAEANFLFIAGSDTTATAMCSIFFYLPRHPQVYRKLTQEIRSTFNSADEIHGGTVSSCRYLRACIDEAMRMTPVAPSELPREVLPGGLKLGNDFFPPGTLIGSAGWSLMHSEDAFGDPWVYRPERWIADEENGVSIDDVSRAQAAFIPFSTGPSNCLGQKLAMLEMMLTVGRTLYVMDLKAPSGDSLGAGAPNLGWGRRDKNVFQVRDAYLSLRDGPMVQFKRRET
ncbi:putative cytochrome 67 [Halenospora varia]|nr:putative cytochrome 67 [Halenospora varia]